jgi:trans-aconitate methyltransferase
VLLERLAAETGGLRLDSPAASFSRDTVREWQPQPLWHYLFAAALVLFIADVAVRRFRLTPTDLLAALGTLARRLWGWRPSGWRAALRGLSPLRASRSRPRL